MKPPIEVLPHGHQQTATAASRELQTAQRDFERLPRESAKAYAAFKTYLDAGPQRSLTAVAQSLGKSKALMERWSRRYDWMGRVAAYGAYVADVERQAIEALARERAVEWSKVHEDQRIEEWKRRTALLKLADEMIARWQANPKKCGTLEGIARVLELASKLGRLAGGMESERSEAKESGTVRVEVSLALEKIYGQVLADGHPAAVDVDAVKVESAEQAREDARPPGGAA